MLDKDTVKHIVETSDMPLRVTKKVKVTDSRKKDSDFKPINPNFCDHVDENGKKCGNYLNAWNTLFYNQYEMCEECYNKYIKKEDEK